MATSKELNKKADDEELSECPICQITFTPVFQCKSGHSFCQKCTSKLFPQQCPLCRENAPTSGKRCLEEMIKVAKIFCPNKSSGCGYKLFNEDQVNDHLKECIYAEMSCPMEISAKCSWKGIAKIMKDHYKEHHEAHFVTKTDEDINLEEVNVDKDDRRVYLHAQGNFSFIVTFKIDTSLKMAYWTVQHVGSKKAARQYIYEIHVTSKHDARRKIIFMEHCFNHGLNSEEVFRFGKCGVMPLSVLPNFIKDEKFSFKFSVKKDGKVNTEPNEPKPEPKGFVGKV